MANNPLVSPGFPSVPPKRRFYVPVVYKFILTNSISILWLTVSFFVSLPWIRGLSRIIGPYTAWPAVVFIALFPGYLSMFLLFSLLLDRPPQLNLDLDPPPVSLIMATYNEQKRIEETLRSLRHQNYRGLLEIIMIDDGSTDETRDIVSRSGIPDLRLIRAEHAGKAAALNRGLREASCDYTISIDADTFLHPEAVTRIMGRVLSDPPQTAAVAGCVLAKNSRQSLMTRLQEWDYFLAIASVKRQQALYQGTLVAQGAFSVYKTRVLKEMNGWPACIGEDIVLTWAMIKAGYRIGF